MKKPIKMLLVGDSKAGKTGALVSLLRAGYNVRVLDMDNGTDFIEGALKRDPAALARFSAQVCTDGALRVKRTALVGGKQIEGFAFAPDGTAWDKALAMFHSWPEFGPIETWGEDTVFVIDSLSFLSQAALNWVLKLNGRFGSRAIDMDIGDAQTLIRGVLGTLFNTELRCNVIVITHLDYRGGNLLRTAGTPTRPAPTPDHNDLSVEKAYPMTLGKALNNVVGRYFNTMFLVQSKGTGDSLKRVICTKNTRIGTAVIDLASVDPEVPAELPIETGLAEYFRIVKGDLGRVAPKGEAK